MTRQEIFNKVWDWFIVQENPLSIDNSFDQPKCLYRGPNGERCAVGVLIKDEDYTKELENKSASSDRILSILSGYGINTDTERYFLRSLQNAHDRAAESYLEGSRQYQLDNNLRYTAYHYNLSVPGE